MWVRYAREKAQRIALAKKDDRDRAMWLSNDSTKRELNVPSLLISKTTNHNDGRMKCF